MHKHALFSVIGIEIEYMIVDKNTLNISPSCDSLIEAIAGKITNEFALNTISISNELALHVLELKNHPPQRASADLINQFQTAIQTLVPFLAKKNLCLMPTASHPWMDPHTETKRWPHDNQEIYQIYDKIFDCRGHGWSNLQSIHVNLPFANDTEFNFLHNAIRLILPILPSLSASSPIHDGKYTNYLDSRLIYYNNNQKNIPQITGEVIPEFVQSEADYQRDILQPMYKAIHPFDPQGLLHFEWLNSRGAIPKFEYGAIEIRLLDTQECVSADLSIALAIHETLKSWQEDAQRFLREPLEINPLKQLYLASLKEGLNTPIEGKKLKQQLGLSNSVKTCRDAWHDIIDSIAHNLDYRCQCVLEHILTHGNLSERILKKTGNEPSHECLKQQYGNLINCLQENRVYA